jgi:hypothetical protein
MALSIPPWVPKTASDRLNQLHARSLGQDERAAKLLERLATYPIMKTEVWKRLPRDPAADQGQIIDWVFDAFTIFPRLLRPFPRNSKRAQKRWAEHRREHEPLTDPAYLSTLTYSLWDAIFKAKPETELYWHQLWEGDEHVTPSGILTMLAALQAFYGKMYDEYQKQLRSLPNSSRWSEKAAQKFLSDHLSRQLNQTYKRPLDPVVAALVTVAFDRKNTNPETIRGRRRGVPSPEKIVRKAR